MTLDPKRISDEYRYLKNKLETEVNLAKLPNFSLTPKIMKSEENHVTTREQEISYSLSKLIKNLRIESNKAPGLKTETEIIESANNSYSFKSDKKSENTENLIKTQDNEISYSLSDQIKKLTIVPDTFLSKVEEGSHKHEIYLNKHCFHKPENSSLSLEGKDKALKTDDSTKSTEKCHAPFPLSKLESNMEQKHLLSGKRYSSNPIDTHSLSKKENCTLLKNKYSNKGESPTGTNEENISSLANKVTSENTQGKYEIKTNDLRTEKGNAELSRNIKVHEEFKNTQSLKKGNSKIFDCCCIIKDKKSERNEESSTEIDQIRILLRNCYLNKKVELEESDENFENNDEVSASDKNNDDKYYDNDKGIVYTKYDEKNEDVNEEKINKESDKNKEEIHEDYNKKKEDIIEDSNDYKSNFNEDSDEEKANIKEEIDEDQNNYSEEFGDQIRPHGPITTLFKTHMKKPYATKCETLNSHAFASSFSSQRAKCYSLSSETQSDDYSIASYTDSECTSSPFSSTSHSSDDLEENRNAKVVNDELSEVHDEISNFLQATKEPDYLNLIENLFEERLCENYSTATDKNTNQYKSYEDSLRSRNLIANEILGAAFDNESSIKNFSKLAIRESQNRENSNSSLNDDSYNQSLREMFDNEAILQTVEANINSRENLLLSESNFNSFEVHTDITTSHTNTLPITHSENFNLFAESGSFESENLSFDNLDKIDLRGLLSIKESSPRSLYDSFETRTQSTRKETFGNSTSLNVSKKSVLPNKIRTKKISSNRSSTNTVSVQENSQVPLKCKIANGFSKQLLRSILHNDRLLLLLGKYYKRTQDSKDDIIYVTELRGSKGKHLNLTNLHIAVINSDLEEIYAIVEVQKQYNKTFADINRKDVFGKTALDYAIENGNQVVIDYLIENTAKQSIVIGKKV